MQGPFQNMNKHRLNKLIIDSDEMHPLFNKDDIVYYQSTPSKSLKVNDLVVIKTSGSVSVKRILYTHKNSLVVRADNEQRSQVVPKNGSVIGKITSATAGYSYIKQSGIFLKEIRIISNLFHRKGINYVFLKGLPLHLYYEKTFPQRLYYDCDLLIDRIHYCKTEKILYSMGYKKVNFAINSLKINRRPKETVEESYSKLINDINIIFDVHFCLNLFIRNLGHLETIYPQKLLTRLTADMLNSKKIIAIQNSRFPILTAPYLIIYLALHFFHHNFHSAFRLEFLDKIIRRSIIDWKKETEIIKYYRLQNFVYPTFILLKKHYNTPFPQKFLSDLKPSNLYTCTLLHLDKINIFNEESREMAAITRFKYLFLFSPIPLWKRCLVFLDRRVIYSILWVVRRRLLSAFKMLPRS